MHPRIVAANPKFAFVVDLTFADGSRGSATMMPAPSSGQTGRTWILTCSANWRTGWGRRAEKPFRALGRTTRSPRRPVLKRRKNR